MAKAKPKTSSAGKKIKKVQKGKKSANIPKESAKPGQEKGSDMDTLIHQILISTKKGKEKQKKKQKKPKAETEEVEKIEGIEAADIDSIEAMPLAGIEDVEGKKKEKGKKQPKKGKKQEMLEAGVSFESLGPEVAKERISTKPILKIASGIQGLDDMTDGGFEEKSIILVNGDPGAGKTILGLQFLYAGAQKGEAGLYISFGEPREWLYPRMKLFGMDFQELEDKKLFFVIEYQPHEIAKLMQEEGGTIYDIVTAYKVKRIVVDPITPYLVQFENLYDARLALVRFMNVVRKWNATTLLLNEVSTRIDPHPTTVLTEFLTDGVLNLIHRRTEEGIQLRGLEIWKLCGIAHMEVARPFAFTKRGIVVYPTERMFSKTK